MYSFYTAPSTLDEALALKATHGDQARIIAGGTDLLIELDRGLRAAPDGSQLGLIDITRIAGLDAITQADGEIQLGPLVTHNQCVASPQIVKQAFPLARACWEVGAPQIRNRATVAGNIITASPANDTIVPLMALDATVTVASAARGERTMSLQAFCTGFRQVDLAQDEILTRIAFPALHEYQRGTFIKLGLRRAQAISVNTVAAVITFADDGITVADAALSLGAVAPTIVRAEAAETFLHGKQLDESAIDAAARLAQDAAQPIDDIRADATYRLAMVATLMKRALGQIATETERQGWPAAPVMLWGKTEGHWVVAAEQPTAAESIHAPVNVPVNAQVNGQPTPLAAKMTLLDSLRDAGYLGVKEGCAEGECGACTVFMDGMAVMACMLPSERAAGSTITTVEGLTSAPSNRAGRSSSVAEQTVAEQTVAAQRHPVQQAFIDTGGVQCGYCTPGFIMSAAKLLEERPHPTRVEAAEAVTGNFCRCTGYRKILDAIVAAGRAKPDSP